MRNLLSLNALKHANPLLQDGLEVDFIPPHFPVVLPHFPHSRAAVVSSRREERMIRRSEGSWKRRNRRIIRRNREDGEECGKQGSWKRIGREEAREGAEGESSHKAERAQPLSLYYYKGLRAGESASGNRLWR